SIRNGINLTDPPLPRGYRLPGRRPHVPSSKPTMSKSRRASSPGSIVPGIGCTDQEEARNERETSEEAASVAGGHICLASQAVNRVSASLLQLGVRWARGTVPAPSPPRDSAV